MKKYYITIGILVFIFSTIFVLSSEKTDRKKVEITNQNFVISHRNTGVKNESVKLGLKNSELKNTDIQASNTQILTQDIKAEDSEIYFNYEPFHNQDTEYDEYDSEFDTQEDEYKNELYNYELQQFKLQEDKQNNQKRGTNGQYEYRNINWSIWKSNFVNKIVDDSMNIKSLDNYGIGSWFYYSFIVTKQGEIKDIIVRSMYLNKEDKQKIANLIKSYEYQDITIFPPDTTKKETKVDAIMILGPTEKKSKPSDFNEIEKVKIFLPN